MGEVGHKELSLEGLTDRLGGAPPGSLAAAALDAELRRRQIMAQIEAAEATTESAVYTHRSAAYMLWSVCVLTAAAVVNTITSVWALVT
jgi:hypothetical protein